MSTYTTIEAVMLAPEPPQLTDTAFPGTGKNGDRRRYEHRLSNTIFCAFAARGSQAHDRHPPPHASRPRSVPPALGGLWFTASP